MPVNPPSANDDEPPPPSKIGAGWGEKQWLLKAFELADVFSSGGELPNLGKHAVCQMPKMPEHQPCHPLSPPPPCRLVRCDGEREENLIAAVEHEGFHAIP